MRMSNPYFVGAAVCLRKVEDKEGNNTFETEDVHLEKIGPKPQKAQRWLQSHPPINTPDGGEIKRLVFRMPIGYREHKNVIEQFKKKGFTYERARFEMLSRHAGPDNTLVYIDPKLSQNRGPTDQQVITQPKPDEPAIITPVSNTVVDAHGSPIKAHPRKTQDV